MTTEQRVKSKPTPSRVPSDDCVVTVDGVEYTPHVGEWVDVFRVTTAREMKLLNKLEQLRVRLEAVEGDDDAMTLQLAAMDESFDEAVAFLAGRIVGWNWTDERDRPLPEPTGDVIRGLALEEIYYLVGACRGDTPSESKNGSRLSPTSTWDTAQQPNQES